MGNILLCGVQHPSKGGSIITDTSPRSLLNDESQTYFDLKILPRINNESVLILEGCYGTRYPDDKTYDARLCVISENLLQKHIYPDLIGCDDRFGNDINDALRWNSHFKTAMATRGTVVCFDELPHDYSQLMEFIRTERNSSRTIRPLSSQEKQSLKVTKRGDKEFEDNCVRKVRQNSRRDCFVIAGLLHCLHLHVLHGWDLEVCFQASGNAKFPIEKIYAMYYTSYCWKP